MATNADFSVASNNRASTKRLIKAGILMGIEVLDHIIIGHGDYYSFREREPMLFNR